MWFFKRLIDHTLADIPTRKSNKKLFKHKNNIYEK